MAYVIIDHTIGNRDEFARIFNDPTGLRALKGSKGSTALVDIEDPQHVLTVFEWTDVESAMRFAKSIGTEQAIAWASSGTAHRIWVAEDLMRSDT